MEPACILAFDANFGSAQRWREAFTAGKPMAARRSTASPVPGWSFQFAFHRPDG